MQEEIRQLIEAIHNTPTRLVFVTAGAGSNALSDLLAVGGASRTLLEAVIPYSQPSFDDFLGQTPSKYVSGQIARLLAGHAFLRARQLETEDLPVMGVACTAAIASDRPKRGQHRAHIATWQSERVVETTIILDKGARDRAGEEMLVSRLLLNRIAAVCGVEMQLVLSLHEGDQIDVVHYDFFDAAQQLAQGQIDYFCLHADGSIQASEANPPVILSGAFNPLHDGHLGMAAAASEILEQPVAFELAAVNVDKPPLPTETILHRIGQFAGKHPVFVSNAPTYLQKVDLYPGATFVIGYDTAVRLFDTRYYQHRWENVLTALDTIRARGCRFLVAGRVGDDGIFRTLEDVDIPPPYTDLFLPIPAERFRNDISSSALRQANQQGTSS